MKDLTVITNDWLINNSLIGGNKLSKRINLVGGLY